MAFCSKCGAQMEDGNKVCPACGDGAKVEKVAKEANQADGTKGSGKKLVPVIGAVVAVILLVVIMVTVLGGGAKKPIKSLVKTMNSASYELEDYMGSTNKLYSDLIVDAFDLVGELDKDIKEDLDDAVADTFEKVYDKLEDKYGKDIKITYEIEDEEEIDKEELKDMEEALAEVAEAIADEELSDAEELTDMVEDLLKMYRIEDALEDVATKKNIKKVAKFFKSVEKSFGKASIKDGYVIIVDVKIEGEDDDAKFKDIPLTVLKINGKWGIEPSSLMNFLDTVIGLDIEDVAEDVLYSIMADMMS